MPSHALIPPADDPSTLFIVAGMQPFKPYFLGLAEPPAPRVVSVQKVPPRRRQGHRPRGRRAAPTVTAPSSRCSATSRSATTSRTRRSTSRWEFVTERMELDPERLWATVHEGDPVLGARRGHGRDRGVEAGRDPARADRAPRQGQLLAGGRDRALRAVLGDLLRPRARARLRPRRLPARLRVRPLHGVLQPRLHGVRPAPGQRARAAADPERRHRASGSSAAPACSRRSTRSSTPTASG